MTLTLDGIRYCLQKYGDIGECCVSTGIIFDIVDDQGNTTTGLEGGTAYIVDFITLGILNSITLTTPARPTITNPKGALDAANGSVTVWGDAGILFDHDETSGDQWCYDTVPECMPDGSTKCVGYDLYTCTDGGWILTEENSSQCGYTEECESITTEAECLPPCYWYAKYFWEAPSCHTKEQNMMDYLPFIVAGVGGTLIIAAVLLKKTPPPAKSKKVR